MKRKEDRVGIKWRREKMLRKEESKRESVSWLLVSQSWSNKGWQCFQNLDKSVIDSPNLFWVGFNYNCSIKDYQGRTILLVRDGNAFISRTGTF